MKKNRWIVNVFFLVFIVAVSMSRVLTVKAGTISDFINDNRWKNGVSWGYNNPSIYEGNISQGGGIGCNGYVRDFTRYVYGKTLHSGTKFTDRNELNTGDVGYWYNSEADQHWFAVIGRNGNWLHVAEGNYSVAKDGSGPYIVNVQNNRYNIQSMSFSYGYHYGGTPIPDNESWSAEHKNVTQTNALLEGVYNAVGSQYFGFKMVRLYDAAGNSLGMAGTDPGFTGTSIGISYDVNKDIGIQLTPGTKYQYQFFVSYTGRENVASPMYSFTTLSGDTTKPVITDAKVIDVDSTGYTVQCKVTDNVGVDRVQCPTWTVKKDANGNDQDDIVKDWGTNSAVKATHKGDGIYEFKVKISDHNNEYGAYKTHIYAYDKSGNYDKVSLNNIVVYDTPVLNDDGWYYCNVLGENINTDDYKIEYNNYYEKIQKDSPGSDWTNVATVKNEWQNSGSQYTSESDLATSDSRVLVKSVYYHYCGPDAGDVGNYAQTGNFIHYDEIVIGKYGVNVVGTGDDEGHTYYLLDWADGGGRVRCASGVTCDGSYGIHGERCQVWYKMNTYQDRVKVEKYMYTKQSGWVTEKDDKATSVEIRYKEKQSSHTHEYSYIITKQPTCTEKGAKEYKCSCGDSYTEDIPATGHNMEEMVVAPTDTEDGYTLHKCINEGCDYEYKDNIVPHEKTDETHQHSYNEVITKEPTCLQAGVKTYTCECGATYTEGISAKGHNMVETVVAPTATEDGYTLHKCTNEGCDYEYKDNIIPHEKIDETHQHNYIETITKAATCTELGVKTYTCSCGDSYTEDIPAKGHNMVETVVVPTATEDGYTLHKCTNEGCNYEYKDNIVPHKTTDDGTNNTSDDKPNNGSDNNVAKTTSDNTNNTSTNNNLDNGNVLNTEKITLSSVTVTNGVGIYNGMKLYWKSVADAMGYEIEYSVNSDLSNSKIDYLDNNTSGVYRVRNLPGNTVYYYRVRARKGSEGAFEYSEWTSILNLTTKEEETTEAPKTIYSAPKIIIKSFKNNKKGKAVVKWKWNVNADGYQVSVSKKKSFSGAKKKNVNAYTDSIAVSGLKKGKTYYAKVRSYVKDGYGKKVYGKWSAIKKVKIKK